MCNFVHVQFVADMSDICRSEGSRRMSSLLVELPQCLYFPNDDFSYTNDLGKLSDQTTHYWCKESIFSSHSFVFFCLAKVAPCHLGLQLHSSHHTCTLPSAIISCWLEVTSSLPAFLQPRIITKEAVS